jgi:hypothetical protein
LAKCERNADGTSAEISGPDLYRRLTQGLRDFSVHPRQPWAAVAQADPERARIALPPYRIAYWTNGTREEQADLINGIAHETTHIISTDFQDAGHGTRECPDDQLVSYGVGNLVEALWLKGGSD